MRARTAAGLAMIATAVASTASARIVLVQTPAGPVYRNIAEPAGTAMPEPSSRRLAFMDVISTRAAQHGVEPKLVEAIIACESNFDPHAVSAAGAQGLMQLMPETARALRVTDSFDVEQNIDGGTRHLGSLVTSFGGDWRLAVAAYNAGEGAVRRAGGIPPFRETRDYVERVRHYLTRCGVDMPGSASASSIGPGMTLDETLEKPWLEEPPAVVAEAEPAPPPVRKGPRAVLRRDAKGRAVFTNRPESRP